VEEREGGKREKGEIQERKRMDGGSDWILDIDGSGEKGSGRGERWRLSGLWSLKKS